MKIILQSMGYFDEEHDKNLKNILHKYGYKSIFDIEARTDQKIIKWLKDKTNSQSYDDVMYKSCGTGGSYLFIGDVDVSRNWLIEEYDSAEGIAYLNLENKDMNLYRIVYK